MFDEFRWSRDFQGCAKSAVLWPVYHRELVELFLIIVAGAPKQLARHAIEAPSVVLAKRILVNEWLGDTCFE